MVNAPSSHQSGTPDSGAADAGPDAGGPSVPAEQFCAELADVLCSGARECCAAVAGDDSFFEGCVARRLAVCEIDYAAIVTSEPAGYDAEAAHAVLEEGRALTSACGTRVLPWLFERDGLLSALKGTRQPGEDCTPGNDEDIGAYFSCMGEGFACLPVEETRFVCSGLAASGLPCRVDSDCMTGLRCDRADPESIPTCQQRLPAGSPCDRGAQCANLLCLGDSTMQCADVGSEALYCSLALDM